VAVAVARSRSNYFGIRLKSVRKTSWKPVFAAIALAVNFVLMGVWIRMMAGSFSPFQQVYLRILIAGILAAILFRGTITLHFLADIRLAEWLIYGLRGFFANTIGVGLFTVAILHAQLATVSFISSLPILGLLAWLFFREKINRLTIPFIALSVLGLGLLTGINMHSFRLGYGELMAIIAMLGFNIGYMMSRMHPQRFTNMQNTTIVLLTAWIPLLVLSLILHESQTFSHASLEGWVGLGLSAILNVSALYGINYVFSNLKAYVAGNLLLLEGVFALAIGFLLYGEVPTLLALEGAVIILVCGFAISQIDKHTEQLAISEQAT
jgi:drug/metabolite transporter (DMT)-like permease